MIQVHIMRDREGFIRQFTVKGHAEYAKSGKDIVCSAVSVTAYNAVNALEALAGLKDSYTERDGYMCCSIPENLPENVREAVRVILETSAIGFKQIGLSYRKYVSVVEEEV